MDEQSSSTPSSVPQPPIPAAPPIPPIITVRPTLPPWLIGLSVIVLGLVIVLGIKQFTQRSPIIALPTPTPIRQLSPFATTSAFITLDNTVAAYSTAVKAYNTSDPSLSPPVIDLPLGF